MSALKANGLIASGSNVDPTAVQAHPPAVLQPNPHAVQAEQDGGSRPNWHEVTQEEAAEVEIDNL